MSSLPGPGTIRGMNSRPYRTASIGDLERPDGWSPLRRELGVASFGINAWTAHEPGGSVIPEHDEVPSGHEELYVVTAGRPRSRWTASRSRYRWAV